MKNVLIVAALLFSAQASAQIESGERQPIKVVQKSDSDLKSQPLIVIDGVVLGTLAEEDVAKKMKDIDPNTIDSIDVLKGDAAEKSIYATKAAGGVIVIKTKKKKD